MLTAGKTTTELRRAPRARVDLSASVDIRPSQTVSIAAAAAKMTFKVLLRDASLSGIAFVAPRGRGIRGPDLLDRGARLTLKIPHGGRSIEIPASVVWSLKAGDDGQPVAAGVRLHPEAVDAATRRNWDAWVRQALAR